MSFFELDGGAKAKKSKKPKATKKASGTKKTTSGTKKTKKTKKGGNFLGTVSELFAPAGWENFVTAAGLLALDRTDNYIRKSKKDSKKQKGGADDATTSNNVDNPHEEMESFTSRMTGGARKRSSSRKQRGGAEDATTSNKVDKPHEEMESFTSRMTGGARKRSSSRKQRGGSDGHHTVEYLDSMMNKVSQNGGAKKAKPKRKGKVRKQRGGDMTPEQETALYNAYTESQSTNKNSQNETRYDAFIAGLLTQLSVEVNPTNIEEAKLVIDLKKAESLPTNKVNKSTMINNAQRALTAFRNPSLVPSEPNGFSNGRNASLTENNSLAVPAPSTGQNASLTRNAQPAANAQQAATGLFGGKKSKSKPKSKSSSKKSKSSSKKPKAKKPKTKGRK